jgi:hypothetical protein
MASDGRRGDGIPLMRGGAGVLERMNGNGPRGARVVKTQMAVRR